MTGLVTMSVTKRCCRPCNCFARTLRQDDLIARFGGDEFYILLDIN